MRQLHDGKAAREERNASFKAPRGTNGTATKGIGTQKSEDKDCEIHEGRS